MFLILHCEPKKITINADNTSWQQFLSDLSARAEVNIFLRIAENIPVTSLNFYEVTLDEILQEIAKTFDLILQKENKKIILSSGKLQYWNLYNMSNGTIKSNLNALTTIYPDTKILLDLQGKRMLVYATNSVHQLFKNYLNLFNDTPKNWQFITLDNNQCNSELVEQLRNLAEPGDEIGLSGNRLTIYSSNHQVYQEYLKNFNLTHQNLEWQTYEIKLFCEESVNFNLPTLADGTPHTKQQEAQGAYLWKELETNIKNLLSNQKNAIYTIDRITGCIHIFASTSLQKICETYISKVNASSRAQVKIECKVFEVSNNIHIDMAAVINQLSGTVATAAGSNAFTTIASFAKDIGKIISEYGATIKTLTEMVLVLNNQTTGYLSSKSIQNFTMYKGTNPNTFHNQTKQRHYQQMENTNVESGFALSIVPCILNKENIALKIRPSLAEMDDRNNTMKTQNKMNYQINKREFISTMVAKSGQCFVLGYLNREEITEPKYSKYWIVKIWQRIFSTHHRQQKYIFLVIRATILDENGIESLNPNASNKKIIEYQEGEMQKNMIE